jgi:hypothetical protein
MAGATQTPKTSNPEQGSAGKGRGTKAGRPTDFSEDLAAEICGQIAEGKSLRKVCSAKKMPAISTVMKWLADDEHSTFVEQYAHAREAAADALADDIQDISDGVLNKKYDPQAARVAMDGKKWIASKLKPKKYGDKLDLTGEQTVTHKFKDLDDEQLDAAISATKNTLA